MPRSEAAGDKFFRILRFSAPTVCTIHRESRRVVRSFTRSRPRVVCSSVRLPVRSLARSEKCDRIYGGRMRCSCDCWNRYALSSSLLSLFSHSPQIVRSRCPRAFRPRSPSAASFSPRRLSAVRTTPMRQWFYLIALLCFIEQLLR